MSSSEGDISEDAIQNLMNFGSEIFDAHFVQDVNVRRAFCRQILSDSVFLDFTSDKFDLLESLNNGGIAGRVGDSQETVKPTVAVGAGLSSAQKAVLIANNMDFNIVFKDSNVVPHALAYAQRVVDLTRLRSSVNYRRGTAIDIGGNYSTHAMSGATVFHSCTLNDNVNEQHRQTQRDVNLLLGGFLEPSKCTEGVENCDVYAPEGISLHTIPMIDPAAIPRIFQRHGFEVVSGVHHYDPAMDERQSGYMPDVEMHWEVVDGEVEFFFDKDSSFSYSHKLSWLKQYSHTNYFTSPDVSFVVYYAVTRVANGNVYWDMYRLSKDTLGAQTLAPQYRYFDSEKFVCLQIPEFNEDLGFSINDPRGYELQTAYAPESMFAHVYKNAMSNEKARPDLPLSIDDVRTFAQTYNYTRKNAGTSMTVEQRLPTLEINRIAKGVYLTVVMRNAQLRIMTGQYTKMFLRIQKRWGDENFLFLLAKCFSAAAIAPFVLLAKDFNAVMDLIGVHMRSVIRSNRVTATASVELPYHLLSPVQVVEGTAKKEFCPPRGPVAEASRVEVEDVDVEQFYTAFKDELKPEHAKVLLEKIQKNQDQAKAMVQEAIQEVDMPDVNDDRASWQEGMNYVAEKVPLQVHTGLRESSTEKVVEHAAMRIYEAGLYNYDVALNVLSAARERCSDLWTGTEFNDYRITSRNNTTEFGIRVLKVVDGTVLPGQKAEDYMVALDPHDLKLIYLPHEEKSDLKVNTSSKFLFVCEHFKIFLGFRIGKKLVSFARVMREPKKIKMRLIDGVPGCGKTHEIVTKFTTEDLIACAVKETATNTTRRVAKIYPGAESRVRTVASCQVNNTPSAKRVYVDEGLLLLPGDIDYLAQTSKADVVEVFGDSAQIGFIDRGSKLGILRFTKLIDWEGVEFRNVTKRSPADACFIMRLFYSPERRKEIKTASSVRRSLTFVYEPNIDSSEYMVAEPNVLVMSVRTSDRDKVLSKPGFKYPKTTDEAGMKGFSRVMTVHEAQGLDVPHSKFIRLDTFENPVFKSRPHMLVGITRHTHSCRVVSAVSPSTDPMFALFQSFLNITYKGDRCEIDTSKITEEDLDDCMVETPQWLQEKIDEAPLRGF